MTKSFKVQLLKYALELVGIGIFAALLHWLGEINWIVSFAVASTTAVATEANNERKKLEKLFNIADIELVRVSALANDLEERVIDLRMEVDRISANLP